MRKVTVNVASDGSLVIPPDVARELGLTPRQTVVIKQQDETLLIATAEDADQLLDELDGCLGAERAEAYDFDLKIGDLYEAR
jgi:bifunctional DNA-binding transcriptional regulator/antitoxin component of YhaV-PrlF toxin-antitoxin module